MISKNLWHCLELLKEHHFQTYSHCIHTAKIAFIFGKRLGLTIEENYNLYYMGLLHDIGKLVIPVYILDKEGPLNDEEWKVIKKHPYETVLDMIGQEEYKKNTYFWDGILYHHERWDGKGYPLGLKGKEIPFLSSVIAVADAYDAMTSQRGYKPVLTYKEAIAEILSQTGKQFSPLVIKSI